MVTAEVLGEPADDDGHGAVGARGDEEERGVLEVVVRVHGEQDGEAGDGDADGDKREDEAVLEPVGEEGDDHGEAEGGGPWWDGMDCGMLVVGAAGGEEWNDGEGRARGRTLCLDGGVAVGLDNARGEEGVTCSSTSVYMTFWSWEWGHTPYAGTISPKYINPPTNIL